MKANRQKHLHAKPDVDAAIKKHGFEAVRWVVNQRTQELALRKELAREESRLNERIQAIQKKLQRKS